MNVQRLIEKYKKLEGVWDAEGAETARQIFLQDLEQLDEPQKPVVPQFVAEWIEVCKEHLTTSLYNAMNPNFMRENNQSFVFISWIKKTSNQDIFARAWIDGYTVKEKLYMVKVKGNINENILVFGYGIKRYFFSSNIKGNRRAEHTRKQLEEAGFGWVFDCPGVEVEEVE
nr:MAG TPA: Protein of unknown function (DUF1642) [Caudoviricetes sp.]